MTTYFMLNGEIEEGAGGLFCQHLYEAHVESPSDNWIITINCEGGSVEEGSAIYNTIREFAYQHEIHTHILGKAYSVAALISCSGKTRSCGPLSLWMMHEPSTGFEREHNSGIREELLIMERWATLMAGRVASHSFLDPEDVLRNIDGGKNWYLDAQGLLDHGLVDYIV